VCSARREPVFETDQEIPIDLTSDIETTRQIDVLFVSATVPYPATDGGRIRVLNLIRCLCQTHKVTLLTFITSPVDEQGAKYLSEMGVEVVGVRPQQRKAIVALCSLLRSFVQGKPLTVAKYYSVGMARALEGLLKSRRFDIVHFEMLHTGQYLLRQRVRSKELRAKGGKRGNEEARKRGGEYPLPRSPAPPLPHSPQPCTTVLGEQNIDSDVWYRLARTEPNPLRKLIFHSQYRSFMSYESRVCRYFDMCICVSEQDQEKLALLCPGTAIEVVPNGVDSDYFKPDETKEDETRLVFTGSMDWHPNEDAVLYFCDRVLPFIRAELPEIKFYIVGSNPTGRVLKLRGIQGVTVTGLVEDVRPYIAGAAVYVVPLRIGGGTRLKILQALAMEKAVVSTSIGCEGLSLQPDKHLLVADEPRQFAARTVQLLKDSSLRSRLGSDGRALIQERYDWNVIARKLEFLYRCSIQSAQDRDKIEECVNVRCGRLVPIDS
jgi:glycosyltransferase involved in cell wall biosynthesis